MHTHSSTRRRRFSVGTGTTALSLGLCLCAGQLVGTPAVSAAPVVQAAAAAKPTVKVSHTYSTKNLAWGSKVRITVRYTNAATGKAVTGGSIRLQAIRGGKWINWTTRYLAGKSSVVFTPEPHVSGYFRVVYSGTGSYRSVSHTSGKVLVKVHASGAKVLAEAKKHTGALYKYGAAGPKRFDCSGFTMYVYKKAAGKKLPHKANTQQRYGTAVSKANKKAGDLIIFRSGTYGYHAAVYAGGGYMYDSPRTGKRVSKRKFIGSNYVVRRLV